jgi:hypothetical protein
MTGFLQAWGGTGSAIALLAATVWLVFTGRLIPRRVHERALQAEEKRGDGWKDAYLAEVARGDVRDQQMTEILTFVRRSPREMA